MLIVILAGSVQGQTTLTFNPSDDTEDRQESPSINYCTLGGIDVRNIDGGSLIYEWNAYAKFDISAIPAGATITSATLIAIIRVLRRLQPAHRSCLEVISG